MDRRNFLKVLGVGAAGTAVGPANIARASGGAPHNIDEAMGVLVDIPKCIGCRRCEYACQDAHDFNPPPIQTFEDKSAFEKKRRPHPRSHTVINCYEPSAQPGQPVYNKFNCMHCNDPACWSACLVTAFTKQESGAVTYNPNRCMGCRYCMVACPFEIPTYDYGDPITPQVRKCNLCAHLVPDKQEVPGCVKICPAEVMTYGKRKDLLDLAHRRIAEQPDLYVDHVYGEHEVGGTSWMFLSSVPFEEVGLPKLPDKAPPRLTEKIQHAEFKYFLPPLMWYGLLGAAMWVTRPERGTAAEDQDHAEHV